MKKKSIFLGVVRSEPTAHSDSCTCSETVSCVPRVFVGQSSSHAAERVLHLQSDH